MHFGGAMLHIGLVVLKTDFDHLVKLNTPPPNINTYIRAGIPHRRQTLMLNIGACGVWEGGCVCV